jgi:hypothetical protein
MAPEMVLFCFVFRGTGGWTQSLMPARQTLYHGFGVSQCVTNEITFEKENSQANKETLLG